MRLWPALALLAACGGKVVGEPAGDGGVVPGAEGDASSSGSDARSTPDAPVTTGSSETGTGGGCTTTGSGSGGSGGCSVDLTESCGDTTSEVTCDCPSATCTCSEASPNGGSSGGGIPFAGCPSCSTPPNGASLFSLCGFPQ